MHYRGRRRIDSVAHRTAGVAAALLAIALVAPAGAQSGLEIMKEQERRHQAKSEESRIKVTLVDPSGKEKERELEIVSSRDQAGLSRVLLKFLGPPDIRNTGLLTWEQPADKEDDQWLYLPATRTPKRIASSSKKNAFMGTDLAYEDLRPEDLDAHTYNVLREEDLGGQKCWVIEALPSTDKEKLESGYGKRVFWVRQDLHLTVQTEFYNKSDKLFKKATLSDLADVGGGVWRAKTVRVETLDRKTATVWSTIEDKVNQKVDENLLTQQGLTRPAT
jgi:outer membrane lipoprotein-sorting protein